MSRSLLTASLVTVVLLVIGNRAWSEPPPADPSLLAELKDYPFHIVHDSFRDGHWARDYAFRFDGFHHWERDGRFG